MEHSLEAATARGLSVRHVLRNATSDLHEEIDAHLSGPFGSDSTAYVDFLRALARGIFPLEDALEEGRVERVLPDWSSRRRAKALAADLADLGADPPPWRRMAPVVGEGAQFGTLYVLEGSRLGGKILLRRALDNPDPAVRGATRYLSHGAEDDFWRSFLRRLEASSVTRHAPQQAVTAARAAFLAFRPEPQHV